MDQQKTTKLITSKKQYEEIITSKEPFIIDYFAVWCIDCDVIEPTYIELSKKFKNITFYKLSVDIQELKDVYKSIPVTSIPSFTFHKDGEEKFFLEGTDDLEKHVETLNEGKTFPKSEKFQFSTNERLLDHSFEYDLLVIGGGSGGFQCAKKASGMGAKVGIFNYVQQTVTGDEWGLGGTCVNVGCIPKKLFHQAGLLGDHLNDSKDFGWNFNSKEHDWSTLQKNVNSYTSKLNWKHEGGARRAKVNYIHAFASFIDQNTVQAVFADGTKKNFTAKYFVIATGGRPSTCEVPGGEHTINSDQIFHLKKSPGKTLIVGGSYVAIETAGFLSSLGNDVTLSVRSQMLRGFDEESVEHVVDSLQKVKILQPCQILKIEKTDNGLSVHMKYELKESTTTFDTVMTAIGRTPSISGLNLEKVGIKVEKDHIVVSDSLQTSISNVYSLGDVVGIMDLTPVAIMQGKFIAEKLFKSSSKKLNYDFIPTTIFSPMEYGVCGISELQSFEKYGKDNVIVYKKSVNVLEFQMGFQHSTHQQAFFKLICLKNQNEKVIGFHYVGPNAGEITGGIAIAMKNNITKEQLDDCVGIHPTLSEIITQLEYGVTKDTGC